MFAAISYIIYLFYENWNRNLSEFAVCSLLQAIIWNYVHLSSLEVYLKGNKLNFQEMVRQFFVRAKVKRLYFGDAA